MYYSVFGNTFLILDVLVSSFEEEKKKSYRKIYFFKNIYLFPYNLWVIQSVQQERVRFFSETIVDSA